MVSKIPNPDINSMNRLISIDSPELFKKNILEKNLAILKIKETIRIIVLTYIIFFAIILPHICLLISSY